ncbi:MAG: czcD2 [Hyphomicrobiales bacterium]|nr:czcD2 [Hyphomicrobiales bacterium]
MTDHHNDHTHDHPHKSVAASPAPHGHAPHGQGHHHHDHAPQDFGKAFAIGLVLNGGFVIVEVIYGLIGNSVALLADAGHNLGDVLGLVVAWVGVILSRRKPSARFTYGLGKSSILAALLNAMFLLVAVGAISWEAIQRMISPEPVATTMVMVIAAIGVLVNGVTAWMFASGRKGDINVRAAFVHMAADAGLSAGVVLAGFVIAMTGLFWIDPLMSLLLNAVILWSTWDLLKSATTMVLSGVPEGTDLGELREFLLGVPGVTDVRDLHVWSLSTKDVALTCHLVMPDGHPGDAVLLEAAHELEEHFSINHPTFQIDVGREVSCPLHPARPA